MGSVSANTAYLASQAPACYTPAGARSALLQFQAWAAGCRQAASMLSSAETDLLGAKVFPVDGATMEGPGADRLRQAVADAIVRICIIGSGLGDLQHEMTVLADVYDLKAQTVGAQLAEWAANPPPSAGPEAEPLS